MSRAATTRSKTTPAPRPQLRVVEGRKAAATVAAPSSTGYGKDALVERFTPLVRHVVKRVAATLPRNVDLEDLFSAGVLGLLDAYAKFDADKGVKFETYAVWRIKGAVIDQLRSLDWASRSMRRKARDLDGVTRQLDQKLGRAASEEEVARAMKISREDYHRCATTSVARCSSRSTSRARRTARTPRRSPTTWPTRPWWTSRAASRPSRRAACCSAPSTRCRSRSAS